MVVNKPLPRITYQDIPRGNTQKHVNREVLRYVVERSGLAPTSRVLDAPCGEGEFLQVLRQYWPAADLSGCDLRPNAPPVPGLRYQRVDLSQPFDATTTGPPFDLITSISGVMCFGNTRSFVASCSRQLRPGGQLVLTNDNILTVRDRLSYLFTGRLRRFRLLFEPGDGLTQLVQHQALWLLLHEHGVRVREVRYTSWYAEDLLFLPFALLLYPFQWWYLWRLKSTVSRRHRFQLFGFKSLLYRHYILVGEKIA